MDSKNILTPETQIATDNVTEATAVATTNVDTTATTDFIPDGLQQMVIYEDTYLDDNNYEEVYMTCNRNINPHNVTAKKKSIISSKGVNIPSLIVGAKAAIKQKIELRNANGEIVDENYPNLNRCYCTVDGQHRSLAIKELRQSGKDLDLHNYLCLPLNADCQIVTILHSTNTATSAWANTDYISSILMNRSGSDVDMSKLQWIKEKSQYGSSTAAFRWADLKIVRIPTKQKLSKAATNKKDFDDVANVENFHNGQRLYNSMAKSFSLSFLGLKCVPEFFINTINKLVKGTFSYDQVIDYLDGFINGTFNRTLADEMEKYKSESGVQTKDDKITAKLTELLESYKLTTPFN